MLKWILRVALSLGLVLAAAFYWLILSGASAHKTAPDLFPIAEWRAEVAKTAREDRPLEIGMVEVSHGAFPSFVVQAGLFTDNVPMSMTSFQVRTPSETIVVGGAVDEATAIQMAEQSGGPSNFDASAYNTLSQALIAADKIVITHEHLDHVMAIARHANPDEIASAFWLNAPQKAALGGFTPEGEMPLAFSVIPPRLTGDTQMIAPGVIVAPAPGHTEGSQVVFVSLQDGREYLLIGDIAWVMTNIEALTTRPILTQYAVFDPNEDRGAVKAQIRALHDLVAAEPSLVIVPSHDRAHLQALLSSGELSRGF